MHFATDLAPQTARKLASAVRKIADRYNARHPEALLRVSIEVGEPRLQAETAEMRCAISIEVEETLSPVGVFAGEISSLVGEDGEVLALFRGTGAELPADPVVGALDKGGHLHCDECGHIRRRRATFVFVRDGALHRVGGDCLERLRLGFAPALAEALSEIEGECSGFRDGEGSEIAGGRAPGLHTGAFLAACACSVRLHGWVSRRQAEGTYLVTTREDACDQLDKRARGLSSDVPTDADRALAGTVREWLRSLDVEAEGFLGSLAVVGRVSFLPTAAQGIAAAAIVAYWRAWAESLPVPTATPYEPVRLTKGKRAPKEIPGSFTSQVQVVRTHTYESAYGLGQVCVFRDLSSGHDLVWHTKPQDLRPGQVGELRGTVKGEGLYRGAYQVSVTRCVFFPA